MEKVVIVGAGPAGLTAAYELLKSNTREGKPKIAMWIFTHAHLDHIQLATDFLARYKEHIILAFLFFIYSSTRGILAISFSLSLFFKKS